MKITAQEEYGLRCLLRLARAGDGRSLTIPEIAADEGLSVPYVAKLLAVLRQAGLIESVRGRSGGYRLAASRRQRSAWARCCSPWASRCSTSRATANATPAPGPTAAASTRRLYPARAVADAGSSGCGSALTRSPWPTCSRAKAA